jgi:DNA-binding beta-propeller fold protein YncE
MKRRSIAAAVLAAALTGALASAASADTVFVQTDNQAGNQVVAYHRAPSGTLTQTGIYDTGGLGGQLAGSVVDHLASQGSLAFDRDAGLLIAVNAGSDTVSVFSGRGDDGGRLQLRQVIGSGGQFPVSVATSGGLVYVLNALGGGSLQAYAVVGQRLLPLPGANRALGLDPNASPQFVNTPGQVVFSPDGTRLLVSTKANGSAIDVFRVGPFGRLSAPTVNAQPGVVPFALAFDRDGSLLVADAGTDALSSFALRPDGTLTALGSTGTGQVATCWLVLAGPYAYTSNAGSGSLTQFLPGPGAPLFEAQTATDRGTVDAAATPDGQFVYVQTGATGTVDEFAVGAAGALTEVGSVTVPGAVGGEGIVATG